MCRERISRLNSLTRVNEDDWTKVVGGRRRWVDGWRQVSIVSLDKHRGPVLV